VPELILLKINQRYLDYIDPPFNKEGNIIGRPIRKIATEFVGTESEVIFNTVLETQMSVYIKEFRYDTKVRGVTYWDASHIPVFENGKMKYICSTYIEVTERVLKNQNIELQNRYQTMKGSNYK